jgi:hypothetical protein
MGLMLQVIQYNQPTPWQKLNNIFSLFFSLQP